MTFEEFVDVVVERLHRLGEASPPNTFFQLQEVVSDLDVPYDWIGQAAKLLEYRLLGGCLYSAHGTPYVRLTEPGQEAGSSATVVYLESHPPFTGNAMPVTNSEAGDSR